LVSFIGRELFFLSNKPEAAQSPASSILTGGDENALSNLNFKYPLRRYQKEILELIKLKLSRGEQQLHVVAPPGAGKTIIGLQLVSELKYPALIVSPTTTIQAQWAQKLDLFLGENTEFESIDIIGTHEHKPLKPITLLTYQVLSTPGGEQEYLEKLAHKAWIQELISGKASFGQAEVRILELMQNNRRAYNKELSRHISRIRRKLTEVIDLREILHPNALELLQALRRQRFKVVIFDECHHLTDYWAAVMTHVIKQLDDPIVIGLTGTPPEGKSSKQENRYLSLVGDIDYQVPTPALVKEAGLAPFQDLVCFTEPTEAEDKFLEEQHEDFHKLIEELQVSSPNLLSEWINQRINEITSKRQFEHFALANPLLAQAMMRFIWHSKIALPEHLEFSQAYRQPPFIDDWMVLLEDFALNYLKLSASSDNHQIYDRIKSAVGKLGYGITEQGLRKQASPVDRVLAFSRSKSQAVSKILEIEYRSLDDKLKSVVVTDFETMSATAVGAARGVLTEESGGAIAVLRDLLASEISNDLNPCLVTGSLFFVDTRIAKTVIDIGRRYLKENGIDIQLQCIEHENDLFQGIRAQSGLWESKLYVGLATYLLETGVTKCLIGTRGLFGEGWDCQSLNTLIDLTTTTTAMSVKQLRGRSIRLNVNDPLGARKVANNWDVVCIAPDLEKGLNDYYRFVRKHDGYFGISDDGQVECGVGHVHPSFSELTPAEVFSQLESFNEEMFNRALVRDKIYDLWKVGKPYHNRLLGCVEIGGLRKLNLTPPALKRNLDYKEHAKLLRAYLNGLSFEYGSMAVISSGITYAALINMAMPYYAFIPFVPFCLFAYLGWKQYRRLFFRLKEETLEPNSQESSLYDISAAILSALKQTKFLPKHITNEAIYINKRLDGSYRVFLDGVEEEHSQYFVRSLSEAMAPISKQPFVIGKYEYVFAETYKEKNKFFKQYLKGEKAPELVAYHAVPGLLARSEKGRQAFESAWNKYVSPGFIEQIENSPEKLSEYFGIGPSLAQRLLWE
jgi:superfamily II DNA or RNA helicase